jgi:nickel-dependent lactate racemase
MKINLPQRLWYGNTTLELDLPEEWDVEYCPMRGGVLPRLSLEQMETAILNPVGSRRLKDLAKGKKRVVIIFDDMTRPTKISELAPVILRELDKAGVKEADITFICSLGTHGALTMNEFRKKLGQDILERFRVFNHNIYENCVEVGTTSRGTRLLINREVMEADLKIAIGCVTAHGQVGFSGGGKIILPGIAHIDSISHYHLQVEAMDKESTGLGKHDNNILRKEIDEAAGMVGVDFLVNVLVNERGETSALFAGDMFQAHEQAVELARDIYATDPIPQNKDLVIANAFVKPNEMAISFLLGMMTLKNMRGTLVIIADSPEGQVVHYLLGRFGRDYGGRQYPIATIPPGINIIIMTPYPDKTFGDWFSNSEIITFTKEWKSTLKLLRDSHETGTMAAVLPNATMQYYAQ